MNKVIHYFWFGKNPKPKIFKTCLKSWKKYLPDWEIKEWTEENCDVYINEFTTYAYKTKNWSFISDFYRCYVLEKYGGLYLDIDVELIGSIDDLLKKEKPFLGFESTGLVNSGLIMYFPNPHNLLLKEMLKIVESKSSVIGEYFTKTTIVAWLTEELQKNNLVNDNSFQSVMGIDIYPSDYFCPVSPTWKHQNFTSNTRSIHHYFASWIDKKSRDEIRFKRFIFKALHPINYLKILYRRHIS